MLFIIINTKKNTHIIIPFNTSIDFLAGIVLVCFCKATTVSYCRIQKA